MMATDKQTVTTKKTKLCPTCGKRKAASEFGRNPFTVDRLQPGCKLCFRARIDGANEARRLAEGSVPPPVAQPEVQPVLRVKAVPTMPPPADLGPIPTLLAAIEQLAKQGVKKVEIAGDHAEVIDASGRAISVDTEGKSK